MTNNTKIIVCPNETKLRLLNSFNEDNQFYDIKFMTKKEFLDNYYFTYDERALYYLVKEYGYNLDVAKVYLDNLFIIDNEKVYKSDKLNFLKDLKKKLLDKGLLIFNSNFKRYLIGKEIEATLNKVDKDVMIGII